MAATRVTMVVIGIVVEGVVDTNPSSLDAIDEDQSEHKEVVVERMNAKNNETVNLSLA